MGTAEQMPGAIALHADVVRSGITERVARALGTPEHVARLLSSTPALQVPWILSVAAMLGFSTLGTQPTTGLTPFLVLAPLLPLGGVAAAYGPLADPAFDIAQAAPTSSFRLMLIRAAAVLGSTGLLMAGLGLLDAGPGWRALAWLLPSLALTVTSLLLGTFISPIRAAAIVALLWMVGIVTVQLTMREPGRFFGGTAQLGFSVLAVVGALVTVNRRDHFEMKRRHIQRQIVGAADAERRKLERNLHDGAQQQLIAMKIQVHLARTLLEGGDEGAAREMLTGIESGLDDAVTDLRELARGMSPPILAERGLVAALRAQVERARLPATVDGEGIGRHAPEVEATLYFCCSEALQNASKYARAREIQIALRSFGGTISFSVRDDGVGFDPKGARRGAGLSNLAERLAAFGGGLEVRSEPGEGTLVSGWLPADPVG